MVKFYPNSCFSAKIETTVFQWRPFRVRAWMRSSGDIIAVSRFYDMEVQASLAISEGCILRKGHLEQDYSKQR